MDELPEVGKEYSYLQQPVRVTRVVPMEGGKPEEAHVEFVTRYYEHGETRAGELSPW